MALDPQTLLQGASILGRAAGGGPSSAASRNGLDWTSLWSSPFQVGDGGNSASTDQSATPGGSATAAAGLDILSGLVPVIVVVGAVAVAVAILKRGK